MRITRLTQLFALSAFALCSTTFADNPASLANAKIVNNTNSQLTVAYQTCKFDIQSNSLSLCSTLTTAIIPAANASKQNANVIDVPVSNDYANNNATYLFIRSAKNETSSTNTDSQDGVTEIGAGDAAIFNNFGTSTLFAQFASF